MACVLRPAVGRRVAILGSCILSSILLIHPQVSRQRRVCVCLCVCVGVGVRGAPWGEAGQSLPVAALGQGMAIQDACLGSQPNLTVASLALCPIAASHLLHVSLPSTLKCTDLPLTLTAPRIPLPVSLFCICLFCNLFICLDFSLFLPLSRVVSQSFSVCVALSLYLSILARLYFFISCAVGGGAGESQGTSEYINSHQKANRAEWRLGALSCEWHWAAV